MLNDYIKTLILSTIVLVIGNNSNYCYSMEDSDSDEIITNNVNLFEDKTVLFESYCEIGSDIKEKLSQLPELKKSYDLFHNFLCFSHNFCLDKLWKIRKRTPDAIRFNSNIIGNSFFDYRSFKDDTITFKQLLVYIFNKVCFESIECMVRMQKIINNYNQQKEQELSNINSSNKINNNQYQNEIENKIIVEILSLYNRMSSNMSNFVKFLKKEHTVQLKLNRIVRNITGTDAEDIESVIYELDHMGDNLYRYRFLKDYDLKNYKSLLQNDERLLNNNIDCNYFEIFKKLHDRLYSKECSDSLMAFCKEIVETHGVIDDLIKGIENNEIPIDGNSIKWDRQYINKRINIFDLNIKSSEKVNFTQLLKYFANRITLLSLNMIYFQIDPYKDNEEDNIIYLDNDNIGTLRIAREDFYKILLSNIEEVLEITNELNDFIQKDEQIKELDENKINYIKSLYDKQTKELDENKINSIKSLYDKQTKELYENKINSIESLYDKQTKELDENKINSIESLYDKQTKELDENKINNIESLDDEQIKELYEETINNIKSWFDNRKNHIKKLSKDIEAKLNIYNQ